MNIEDQRKNDGVGIGISKHRSDAYSNKLQNYLFNVAINQLIRLTALIFSNVVCFNRCPGASEKSTIINYNLNEVCLPVSGSRKLKRTNLMRLPSVGMGISKHRRDAYVNKPQNYLFNVAINQLIRLTALLFSNIACFNKCHEASERLTIINNFNINEVRLPAIDSRKLMRAYLKRLPLNNTDEEEIQIVSAMNTELLRHLIWIKHGKNIADKIYQFAA